MKANAEIAAEYLDYLRQQKLEIFKETHAIGESAHHEVLRIASHGQQASSMSYLDLCEQVVQWADAMGIAKSHAQVKNIAKIVWSKIDERAAA